MDRMLATRLALAAWLVTFVSGTWLGLPTRAEDAAALNVPPPGFLALFNGKDLSGWYGHGTQDPRVLWAKSPEDLARHKEETRKDVRQHWRVEDGVLINDGGGLYATTDEDYGDFELLVDYRTVAGADSGIYLRGIPQVQIWDTTEAGGKWESGADKGSGGLWNNSPGTPGKDPLVLADKPFGEWNHFRIVMAGERVTVFLNEKLVVDHARLENYYDRKLPVFRKGPIQLQTHGGEIRWRNIFLREIPAEEANRILRDGGVGKKAARGYQPIFNGKDFTGWKGPVDRNKAADGILYAQHGTIYTEKEYGDFAVRFDFKLPPGGNNGLAIRYPGSDDTAYYGLCELQVLDDSHRDHAGLDPRQYHGSAYAQAASHRGYQRPVGEWNFQEVTVKGFRITVELNGTRILDADLSQIPDEGLMYPAAQYKGRKRTRGHFGFAGHGNPVQFRGIEIEELGP